MSQVHVKNCSKSEIKNYGIGSYRVSDRNEANAVSCTKSGDAQQITSLVP